MKYECIFANPKNPAQQRAIVVELSKEAIRSASQQGENAELHLQAHALHHAFRKVPKSWRPVRGGVTRITPWIH